MARKPSPSHLKFGPQSDRQRARNAHEMPPNRPESACKTYEKCRPECTSPRRTCIPGAFRLRLLCILPASSMQPGGWGWRALPETPGLPSLRSSSPGHTPPLQIRPPK